MKVFIAPTWGNKPDKADGGIRRVVEAQEKYLPEFGVELVGHPDEADVINAHGTTIVDHPGVPIVSTNHGLYWSRYDWPDWAHKANRLVVQNMSMAIAHTAPSEWVANALRRGMLVSPEVVHHGVDPDEWVPIKDKEDFILWNKARSDIVSDPRDMQELARRMPNQKFVATVTEGRTTANVKVVGKMPVGSMQNWVQHAGLYLATARETFGIGTLEALSCAVPVVGWDWGGQSEIIVHGVTGFLAKPGDYDALADGVRWALDNRDLLGENARSDVLARWTWPERIKQYADIFKRTKDWWDRLEVKVSVIVTHHNLQQYLDDCLRSVVEQDFEDYEIVVIDDASKDMETFLEICKKYVDDSGKGGMRIVTSEENLKLSRARNLGILHSKGRYILPLDADDMLAKHALLTLSDELDKDPSTHIAYGHLDTVNEQGKDQKRNPWPFENFDWHGQMAHLNQLPYSAMIRREVFEATGGYRRRHWRAEDAPFWIKATSHGFRARKVTQASTLVYRMRGDSKSMHEPGDGDWTSWYPWRMGAQTGKDGAKLIRQLRMPYHPAPDFVPWGAQGKPSTGMNFWPVNDQTEPRVTVIIPVGLGHEKYVIDALESVQAQIFQEWECVVVNATGREWPIGMTSPVAGCPWALVIDAGRKLHPAAARNLGTEHARADTLVFLDADDILLPHTIEEMYSIHLGTEGGLVYTDWMKGDPESQEPMTRVESEDFRCGAVLGKMRHSMMIMIPQWAHEKIGGFDETLPGWEDWDYQIALQTVGLCSYRLPEPGFVYRFRTGTIREESFGKRTEIKEMIREKWANYYSGRLTMGCRGCPGKRRAVIKKPNSYNQAMTLGSQDGNVEATKLIVYQGPESKIRLRSDIDGQQFYTFRPGTQQYVHIEDADKFLGWVRNGKPDFLEVRSDVHEAERRVRIPMSFVDSPTSDEVEQADFESMPGVAEHIMEPGNGAEPEKVENLSIPQLKEAVLDADNQILLQWLEDERGDRKRKGALKVLEQALEKRVEPEPA